MKNKIFIVLISILLLTGCTVNYNININPNSIYETIIIQSNNINIDGKVLSTIKGDYGSNYEIEYDTDPEECTDDNDNCNPDEISMSSFGAYKTYSDLKKYSKSQAIADFYGTIDITINNKEYTLISTPGSQLETILSDINYISSLVNELNINISIPYIYKVKEHNATSVNENVYTWTYNKENLDSQIKIVYNEEENLIENENNHEINNEEENNNKKNSKPNYIFWIVLVGIFAIIATTIVNKLKKNDSV